MTNKESIEQKDSMHKIIYNGREADCMTDFANDDCFNCDNYKYCIDIGIKIGWHRVDKCPYYIDKEDKNNVR